jgi:hypothetical protein
MTAVQVSTSQLDAVLGLQLLIAWAGEGLSEPPRMRWWRTDLVDIEGGGDLFHRLFPKTHEWASLEGIREAAIQADQRKRAELAQSDRVRSLFFWGAIVDEQLAERLDELKKHSGSSSPETALALPLSLKKAFNKDAFEEAIRDPGGKVDYKIVPAGREIKIEATESIESCAQKLAAALLPLSNDYPMPFYRLENR